MTRSPSAAPCCASSWRDNLSPPLLTFLKYIFLAVLYLFFLRVLRAVWIELREPKTLAAERVPEVELGARSPVAAVPVAVRSAGGEREAAVVTVGPDQRPTRLVVSAPAGGGSWDLAGETTVGRSPDSGITLPDDTFVSQVHARLFPRDGEWWVEDLGSTNGTYLDGARVGSPVVVRPGAAIQFGQTVAELYR